MRAKPSFQKLERHLLKRRSANSGKAIRKVGMCYPFSVGFEVLSRTRPSGLSIVLVRSNMAPDVPSSQRISDIDIANQINTFLFAGSDTTSLAISWCIHILAQKQDLQQRLRDELIGVAHGMSDDAFATAEFYTELDQLPYLENVCREILRLIPPVHSSIRVALKDDTIPISSPMRWEDRYGKTIKESHPTGIKIARGEYIHIAIEGLNLSKSVWGEDAHEFKWVTTKSAPPLILIHFRLLQPRPMGKSPGVGSFSTRLIFKYYDVRIRTKSECSLLAMRNNLFNPPLCA